MKSALQSIILFLFVAFYANIGICKAQYEDVRCKCVCPPAPAERNSSSSDLPPRSVFVKTFSDPQRCKCENVVEQSIQSESENFCDLCECKWQRRNTTTIKVTVILIICIISLLFLYMLFLLCLDPLMTRRPKTYLEQRNEEVNLDTQSVTQMVEESSVRPRPGMMSRVKQEVSKVRGEQQKWKGQVQEQRRHIFDRHTMLN